MAMSEQSMGMAGGAAQGATYGMALGPVGALAGAAIGAGMSASDSSKQEKKSKREQEDIANDTVGVKRRKLKRIGDAVMKAEQTKMTAMAGLSQAALDWAMLSR